MRESNDVLYDVATCRERLHEDGYLFVRQLLDREMVLGVRKDLCAGLAHIGWVRGPEDARPAEGFSVTIGDDLYWTGLTRMLRERSLHDMTRDPALTYFLEGLYGEPAIRQPRFVPRAVYPHPDNPWSEMAAHQDMPYVQGSLDTLTAWMPMGHCRNSGGALEVLRGSHLDGLRDCFGSGKHRCAATEVDANDPEWRCADFEPGDVLIFTCLTVHRARRNMSELVRLTMDARYQPTESAMCEQLLEPPFYPRVADWPELLDADELERVRNTHPAQLIPFDEPGDFVASGRGRAFDWMRG